MTRYVVLHGHIYQPPREDPWSGEIAVEASAAPFANWNQRITEECYRPNAAARVLGQDGSVAYVRDNYRETSVDVGPTLAVWLEHHAPDVLQAIVDADRAGHTAIAHPWVHAILPLCSPRDVRTLVHWGASDFEQRFGRPAEGMWLPETAVDTMTLEALADEGIAFTLLAPHQLEATRAGHADPWTEDVDPRVPYRLTLPSGRVMSVLTYDGGLSNAVAFEGVLRDGVGFAHRLLQSCGDWATGIAAVVTDFETYGHHHRFGEMALARALEELARMEDVAVVSAAEAIRAVPSREALLAERTAWSCAHGIDRWQADCGCRTRDATPLGQAWRAPLRTALDWFRDRAQADDLARDFANPWAARDAFGEVLSGAIDRERWLEDALAPGGDPARASAWIDLQLHLLLMFTSCGWFFDDAAGHETILVLRHAARALELVVQLGGPDLEAGLVDRLHPMRSEDPAFPDGAAIWAEVMSRTP